MDAGLQLKLLMLVIWLGFVAFSARKFIRGKASSNWPKIKGKVKSSRVEAKSGGNGLTFYSPEIEYQYSLNSQNHTGNNFTYMGTAGLRKKHAEKYVNKYTVGSEIEISYNPSNPEMAVVIPGIHWRQYASMIFLTLMFSSIAFIVEILELICPFVSWCR